MLRRKLHTGTSKTKELVPVQLDITLFLNSRYLTWVPAYWNPYHLTGSCKEPIRSELLSISHYWVLKSNIFQRAPALKTSKFTGEKGHCYFQEIVFSFLSYFRIRKPALIFRRKTSVGSRRRGLPSYSTQNDVVNQLISILLTEEVLSTSGSLHPDFNNNEDPCCDSTAVMSLSGRESLYRDSSEGRR